MHEIVILIKLGGSVITDKSVPLSFNRDAVISVAEAISEVAHSEPAILVHGGGSFGHHYSIIYDMHTKPARYDIKGFAVVRNSMVHLHHLVLDALVHGGVLPYSCPPSVLVRNTDFESGSIPVVEERVLGMGGIAGEGLCPVVYGDAMWCGNGESCILSGDDIMVFLSRILDVRLAIFATNVDGLYSDLESGQLIRYVNVDSPEDPYTIHGVKSDVTGGMARKVKAAVQISRNGTRVLLLNGNKPSRITSVLQDVYEGTVFESGEGDDL